jgi:hypothetical protein
VVIIFLMAALIIAKEFGVLGAATFNGWAKNVGLALPRLMGSGGKAFGSMVGKNTLGRAGAYLDKNAGNTWAGNTGLGRAFREGTYGALAKAKFGGERSFKDEKDRNKENDAKKRQIADNATIKAGAQMDAMVKARGTTASDAEQKVIDDGAIALQKMSASDITTQSPKMLAENAKNLNEGQIKAIIKSDKITDADKENVMKARFAPIDEALAIMSGSGSAADKAAAKTSLEDAVTHLTDTDIENLGYERLKNDNLIAALPYSKIKIATDKKAEGYSPDQKKAFKEAKLAPLLKEIADQNSSGAPAGPNPAIKDKLDKLKLGSEDIASLGKSTLVQLAKFGSLPLSAMSKISESIGSMSERKEIKNAIAESCTDVALKNYLLTDTPLPGLHTFAGNHREESIHKFFDKNPVGMMFDK